MRRHERKEALGAEEKFVRSEKSGEESEWTDKYDSKLTAETQLGLQVGTVPPCTVVTTSVRVYSNYKGAKDT